MAHIKKIDEMASQTVSLRSDALFKKAFEEFEKELKEVLKSHNNIIYCGGDDDFNDTIAYFQSKDDGHIETSMVSAIRLKNDEVEILSYDNSVLTPEQVSAVDDDDWILLNDDFYSDLMLWETLLSIYTDLKSRRDL